MVDVESRVFDKVASAIRGKFPNKKLTISSLTVLAPQSFPYLCIEQIDSTTLRKTVDSSNSEKFAEVVFSVNVFSNKNTVAKSECKEILCEVDSILIDMGFHRMAAVPIFDQREPKVYRISARYRAVVGTDNLIYRR